MKPITSSLGLFWECQSMGIGEARGIPHHWGLTLTLWGGCRANLTDIALLREGTLEELDWWDEAYSLPN